MGFQVGGRIYRFAEINFPYTAVRQSDLGQWVVVLHFVCAHCGEVASRHAEKIAEVGGDRAPGRGEACEGEDHEQGLDSEREGDVLPDDREGAARVGDEPRQLAEVVGHQRDVGGLDRGVGAGGAHGDAEARPRHRGGVVDAVADHRDRAMGLHQALDDRDPGRGSARTLRRDEEGAGGGRHAASGALASRGGGALRLPVRSKLG